MLTLKIPGWSRIIAARDFEAVARASSSDRLYALEQLFHAVTGTELNLIGISVYPAARWPAFRNVLAGLFKAVATIDAGVQIDPRFSSSNALDLMSAMDGLAADASHVWGGTDVDATTRACLVEVANELVVTFTGWGPGDRVTSVMGGLVELTFDADVSAETAYDVFISYKHRSYKTQALALHDALESRGLKCWLDVKRLDQSDASLFERRRLQQRLKTALRSTRCTVFFETYDAAHVDEDVRGSHTAYNWQTFEWRNARRDVLLRMSTQVVEFVTSRSR